MSLCVGDYSYIEDSYRRSLHDLIEKYKIDGLDARDLHVVKWLVDILSAKATLPDTLLVELEMLSYTEMNL
jgi:hypothetical protein